MTFQIALIGTDGFIIASDRRATRGGEPSGTKYTMRCSSEMRKILVSESNGVVCAFSGDQITSNIAGQLIKSFDLSNPREYLQEKTKEIIAAYKIPEQQKASIYGQIIVAVRGSSSFCEVFIRYGDVFVECSLNRLYGGDKGNAAIFFAERYLDANTKRSIEELQLLAAYTVLEGHFLNPTGVGGLDILVNKNGEKMRFLEPEELQILCDRAENLHYKFLTQLF